MCVGTKLDFDGDTKVLVGKEVRRDVEGHELWDGGGVAKATVDDVVDAIVADDVHVCQAHSLLDKTVGLEAVRGVGETSIASRARAWGDILGRETSASAKRFATVELPVDEEIAQDAGRTPEEAVGPIPQSQCSS